MSVKWTVIKGLFLFVILVITTSLITEHLKVPLGEVDFFFRHGFFFLIFITIFPRLTLIISSVPFGGVLWWFGLIFCPRILVAVLATVTYFKTNPVLVVISWLVALSGEVFEKWGLGKNKFVFKRYQGGPFQGQYQQQYDKEAKVRPVDKGDTIEAEYRVKDED